MKGLRTRKDCSWSYQTSLKGSRPHEGFTTVNSWRSCIWCLFNVWKSSVSRYEQVDEWATYDLEASKVFPSNTPPRVFLVFFVKDDDLDDLDQPWWINGWNQRVLLDQEGYQEINGRITYKFEEKRKCCWWYLREKWVFLTWKCEKWKIMKEIYTYDD